MYSTLAEQVCRSIRHYLGWQPERRDIAEDCLQVARISIWKARLHLKTLPEDAQRAYAIVCARRAVVRYLRREQRQQQDCRYSGTLLEHLLLQAAPAVPGVPEEESTPKEWLADFEDRQLGEQIHRLTEKDIVILHCYYVLRLTDSEIAQRLNCSVSAIEKQRQRLLHRLRRKLQQSRLSRVRIDPSESSLPQEI